MDTERDTTPSQRIAVLGAGRIGLALAHGWVTAGVSLAHEVELVRRNAGDLEPWRDAGYRIGDAPSTATATADVVLLAVQPSQLSGLLREIAPALDPRRHLLVSVVSAWTIGEIAQALDRTDVPTVRAMPNTATEVGEGMTCLCGAPGDVARGRVWFDAVGATLDIPEERMGAATALGACGVAFFLRAIRGAMQGGVQIGFHPREALLIAAQTARGAASLLRVPSSHPETEIDRVTTPNGATIGGLNELDHAGFSSAMVRAVVASERSARTLRDGGPDAAPLHRRDYE
jgi:pyrroline-5-carboxylate reductase